MATILATIFFIGVILFHLYSIKNIIIKSTTRLLEIICLTISVVAIALLIYFYANTVPNFLLGIILIITIFWDNGISKKGFVRQYRRYETLKWNDISKINVYCDNNIKIELFGNFMDCTFYFKLSEYDKIMCILKKNVSSKITFNFKSNPSIYIKK